MIYVGNFLSTCYKISERKIIIMQILKSIVPIIENFIIYNDCEYVLTRKVINELIKIILHNLLK